MVLNVEKMQKSNVDFMINLSNCLYKSGTNLVVSPFSLVSALSMVLYGSKGNSRSELLQSLFGIENNEAEFETLMSEISTHFQSFLKDNEAVLRNANMLYSHKGFTLKQEFSSNLVEKFKAITKELDFINDKVNTLNVINGDVSKATNGLINQIIEDIDPMSRVLLVNAIYFKGIWKSKFDKDQVKDGEFKKSNNEALQVKMMHKKKKFPYYHCDQVKVSAIKLDYEKGSSSMVILLPDRDSSVQQVLKSLDNQKLANILENMDQFNDIKLALPKFKLASTHYLIRPLGQLGIRDIFGPNADLSAMSETEKLYVSDVVQKAVIEVNEEGTEAAAVTALRVRMMCLSPEVDFNVNRPFIFMLMDDKNVLFAGVVEDPTEK